MTSPSTSWKEATDTTVGDSTKYGVPDGLKKNNQLFNGDLDVDNVDINSPWFFRSQKCYFLNTAGTFGFLIDSSAAIVADRTLTLPLLTANDTFVFQSHTQSLSNKKIGNYLDSVEIAAPASPAASEHRFYVDSGDSQLKKKNNAGSVVEYITDSDTQTLTNKTLTTPTITVNDNAFTLQDNADNTKDLTFELSGITTSTTRTITMVDRNIDLAKAQRQTIAIAASDETTALTVGTGKATFRMPYAFTVQEVRASLTTAGGTSGTTTIDINESGTTILSTKLTIDQGEKTSETAATPPVISDTSLADDAEITIDIDAISGGATEAGLKVYLIGYET